METIKSLLDDVKSIKGLTSKYALAKALDLPTQRISDYYNGTGSRYPDSYACLQIAKALNREYNEISAIVQIEAEKDESKREEWRKYYKSIGGYAASFMLLVFAVVTFIVTTPGTALANQEVTKSDLLEYKLCVYRRKIREAILAAWNTLSSGLLHVGFSG